MRRIGWKDLHVTALARRSRSAALDLVLERENDPAQVAAQLPANRWYQLVLARLDDPRQREELKRQCTYCHQQGSAATRVVRDEEQWHKVLALMGRMGGMLSTDLRERLPGALQRRLRARERGRGAHRAHARARLRAAAGARGAARRDRGVGARRPRLDAARRDACTRTAASTRST